MGRINLPCNMEREEADFYLSQFDPYFLDREEEFVSEVFEHHLFYETWGRRDLRECTCTHPDCGTFEVDKEENPRFFRLHHGDTMECPRCGNTVTLVALGKMRSFATLEDTRRIVLCRSGPNGALLLTAGWGKKTYAWDDLRPIVDFNEKARICLLPGKRMEWRKNMEWNGYRYETAGWSQEGFVKEPFAPYMYQSDGSYYFMFPERMDDTALKYCCLSDWYYNKSASDIIENMGQVPVRQAVKYLSAYTQYPAMEMAVKIGFMDAVTELAVEGRKNARYLDWNAKTLNGFLRLSKEEAKLLVKNGCSLRVLKEYVDAKKNGTVRKIEEFIPLISAAGSIGNIPLVGACAKRVGCDLKQAVSYLVKQNVGKNTARTLTMWKDYLDMAEKLNYDLSRKDVLMPKNLRDRHDAAAATIRVQEEEAAKKEYNRRRKNLQKLYEFEWNGLLIKIPESAQEIVDEGKALSHCVGAYAARHITGKVDILFLRDASKPDKPRVTIEMTPRVSATDKVNMVQIHGYKNEMYKGAVSPRKAYGEFLDAWMDWLRHGSKRNKKGAPILQDRKDKTA